MNDTESATTSLSALEISGAICARVIHDLSNLISGIRRQRRIRPAIRG